MSPGPRWILAMAVLHATSSCSGEPAPRPDAGDAATTDASIPDHDAGRSDGPIVILMIGDGMGPGQLEAASLWKHGEPGRLFLQTLPHHGLLSTGSLSGTTDSTAAATTMGTGARTFNGRAGLDRAGQPVENLVELAHRSGRAAGLVTTATIPHATPAGFSAHRDTRHDYLDIAEDQALTVRPEVMLGGGSEYFLPAGPGSERTDGGLIAPLEEAGYQIVRTAGELASVEPVAGAKIMGLFAGHHMDYVLDRAAETEQPTLTQMSLAALDVLDRQGHGFFLMIEGARIDMASHIGDLDRAVTETIAFDEAVEAVATWANGREDVTLLVTADHECGGLTVVTPRGAGVMPEVTWRWGKHTNARVDIYGMGPGSERFEAERRDHTWVHAVLASAVAGSPFAAPEPVIAPDGELDDLRWTVAEQTLTSSFGEGFNQLDALRLDADAYGLGIGVEGVFEWERNALVLLLDTDFGQGTGPARLTGAVSDDRGRADAIVASLQIDAPAPDGYGADLAVVIWGGADPRDEDLLDDAGLRGLHEPNGHPDDLAWIAISTNFVDGSRVRQVAVPPVAGQGFEAFLPWAALYPELSGRVPTGAVIAMAAVLVNDDGGYTSNQALPPFPAGTENPGRVEISMPGLAVFTVDSDGDGLGDGEASPHLE